LSYGLIGYWKHKLWRLFLNSGQPKGGHKSVA
jgi:hypothetical protein